MVMRSTHPIRTGSIARLAILVAVATLVGVPAFVLPAPAATISHVTVSPAPSSRAVVVAPAFVPGPGVTDLGPLGRTTPVDVAVGLAGADSAGAAAALALIDAPGSAEYHHFLTASTVADRFGATPANYAAAAEQFRSAGLDVRTSPDRTMLLVSGPAGRVASAFGTTFESYRDGTRTFFSHPTVATLPEGLPWTGAVGLGNVTPIRPAVLRPTGAIAPSAACTGSGGSGLTPCQVEKGYNFSGLIAGGSNGTGFTLAVVDTYDGTEPQTQLSSDLGSFETLTGIAAGTVNYLYPVPTTTNLNTTSTGWGFEEALDIEWARATAPAAKIKMTFAPDQTAGLYGSVDWLVAHQATNVISLSWGENDVGVYNAYANTCQSGCNATTDGSYELLHPVFQAAALEGITVLSATGDCGAAAGTSGVSTDYPASDPYVVGVGGTDLTLSGSNGWSSEVGWGGNSSGATSPGCSNQGGSGGGYSSFPRPYWQSGTGISTNQTVRGEPDVAAIAGGGGVMTVYSGFEVAAQGTSVACPIWAGLVTDIVSYAGAPLGFVNPALYAAAAGPTGSKAFHDITSGNNGYAAARGWDPVTGLGSPNGGVLGPLLTRTLIPPPSIQLSLSATPRYGAAPLTVNFSAAAFGGTTPYAFFDVDFGDYNSSLAPGGVVRHTYPHDGTYSAWAAVFDAASNSSVSEPVEIVVGGNPLTVALNSSLTTPTVNQPVTFGANVSGGTSPYTYNWTFGDGTYLHNGTKTNVTHAFPEVGGFCVTVAVHDSANPQNGGGSNRILELVGGATTGYCPNATAVIASLNVTPAAADLPGDFSLHPVVSGGTAPYTIQYQSDDPYVGLCDCPLFRTVGTHHLTAFVSDSGTSQTTASANVTLYPALRGTFFPDFQFGAAPFNISFTATISGGHGPNSTTWSFGDGTSANGTYVNHTYTTPGYYVAVADASDGYGGNASEAFLITITSSAVQAPLLTGTISPAVHVRVGTLMTFVASVTGVGSPYALNWSFSDGLSGFGNVLSETFPYTACLASGSCPLYANLTATNATGVPTIQLSIPLAHAEAPNGTGLGFVASIGPQTGNAPFTVVGSAAASGMPGTAVGWAFGDGATGSGSPVSHRYGSNGRYTVTASASDSGGDLLMRTFAVLGSGPTPQNIVVFGGPNASAGIAPLRVGFNVSAQGGAGPPYNFTWTFGDGAPTGYGALADHTYLRTGSFNALVTARDSNGKTGSADFPLVVYNGTDTNLTLNVSPNVVHPSGAIRLTVTADPSCTLSSAPGCSAANVTVRATFSVAGATPKPVVIGGQSSFPIPLNSSGTGSIPLSAPSGVGTYVVTVSTTTRNYTGLAVQYLVVNGTAPAPPMDRSAELLAGSVVVGAISAAVAFAALGPRRTRGHQVAEGPR